MSLRRSTIEFLDRSGAGKVVRPVVASLRDQRARFRLAAHKRASRKRIQEFLDRNTVRKLHFGASNKPLPGWLNTDIEQHGPDTLYLDCTETFPIGDETLDFAFCEHFIEHIDREAGLACMRETLRCLKPGGVFRVATPDLARIAGLLSPPLQPEQARYLEQFRSLFGLESLTPCRALNLLMYSWGHRFLYTREELVEALSAAGFSRIDPVEVGQSRHEPLRNVERHQEFCGDEMNRFETMVVEATK